MGTVSELTEEHSKFIIDLVDERSTTTVAGIHELLLIEFPSLSVSPSAVYRHLRTSCALSMKKLEKISVARNSEKTLKRKETILHQRFRVYYVSDYFFALAVRWESPRNKNFVEFWFCSFSFNLSLNKSVPTTGNDVASFYL
jgi:hypothetical protein